MEKNIFCTYSFRILKRFFSISILLCLSFKATAQRKVIDSTAYHSWPSIGAAIISNDGKYTSYTLENLSRGSHTLVLQSTDGKWKIELPNASNTFTTQFTGDGKFVVFKSADGRLAYLRLGTSTINYIPNGVSFHLSSESNGHVIYYREKGNDDLVLLNLLTGNYKRFSSVQFFQLSSDGSTLLLTQKAVDQNELKWVDTKTGSSKILWHGAPATSIVMDERHRQVGFLTRDNQNSVQLHLWKYNQDKEASIVLDDDHVKAKKGLLIDRVSSFSEDGQILFVYLRQLPAKRTIDSNLVDVNVWNYRDKKLMSQQLNDLNNQYFYMAAVRLGGSGLLRLEQEGEVCVTRELGNSVAMVVNNHTSIGSGESGWNKEDRPDAYVINLQTGAKTVVNVTSNLSPNGKYAVYFDRSQQAYFSQELATGKVRNLSKNIPVEFLNYNDLPEGISHQGVAAWCSDNQHLLVYSTYDIWKVDIKGEQVPVNLTKGKGLKEHILFNIQNFSYGDQVINKDERLILNAFNVRTKENAFYALNLKKRTGPEVLAIGPWVFQAISTPLEDGASYSPIKAKNATKFIVRRMSATEAPNYFSTSDFKSFTRLSDLEPQKDYNWYTTELHTWKSLDGSTLQGVLYKPQNFDSNRKYPLIIHYYETKSQNLNVYFKPAASNGAINIPLFTSRGYLVFTPDIKFTKGDPMQGTYDAIVSAAEYLTKLPFVNGKRLGIQGWSFGGWETNYLVTHTKLFAAAAETAGAADIVSKYGSIVRDGSSNQGYFEIGQGRMGGSFFDKQEAYIENSPVYHLQNVTTPLLIMHNTGDDGVPFSQAIEMFTGLRRLGKKVWVLQYKDGGHGVYGKSAEDFTIRLQQFFDHYLMDKSAPIWMTRGISAEQKGTTDGLQLDTEIKTPGEGLGMPQRTTEK